MITMITDPDPAPDPYPTRGFQEAKKSKFVLTVFASYLLWVFKKASYFKATVRYRTGESKFLLIFCLLIDRVRIRYT
jgi:hypothetical protein